MKKEKEKKKAKWRKERRKDKQEENRTKERLCNIADVIVGEVNNTVHYCKAEVTKEKSNDLMCGNILPRTSLHHSCFFLPVSLSTYLLFIHNSSAQLWISCDTLWPFIYLRLQNKMVIHEMLTSIAGTSTRQMFLVCVPTMLACVVTAALWQARGRRSQKKRRLRIPVSVCNVHKIRWRWSSERTSPGHDEGR